MKILFLWPKLQVEGYPTLGGNRQYQVFKEPFFSYPLIPAQIATTLKKQGHDVTWCDCIAGDEMIDTKGFDEIYIEVKAPVYREIQEMFKGYDNVIYYGDCVLNDRIRYDDVGMEIDRELTHWWLYAYNNGNFKNTPGTYIMSARDCWYNKCTFCSWGAKYKSNTIREPKGVVNEIIELKYEYGIKDFFDDSGTIPQSPWIDTFCDNMPEGISLGCNCRFGSKLPFGKMKRAGFRMLLYGLESANVYTLNKINKGIKLNLVENELKEASQEGLEPHLTCMFGYPWETEQEAFNTVNFVHNMLKKGYAKTCQASLVIPYPNTPLYQEAKEHGWLLTEDWSKYDQSQPVMKCNYDPLKMIKKVYGIAYNPIFLYRKLTQVKTMEDIKQYTRIYKKIKGHL